MSKKTFTLIIILCFGLILAGCPKKRVMREEPSSRKLEDLVAAEREKVAEMERAAERERASERERSAEREKVMARLEAERKEREARERERERIKEEGARKIAQRELEKSLVAKKYPGIEGEVFESNLLKDIHFDYDKYDIRPSDTETLKQIEAFLRKYPTVKIQIEGHCDERGSREYNLALGERRAYSVKRYLVSLGIPENRISTISYGEERPLDPGHNEEAWAKNRRAHFVILSK